MDPKEEFFHLLDEDPLIQPIDYVQKLCVPYEKLQRWHTEYFEQERTTLKTSQDTAIYNNVELRRAVDPKQLLQQRCEATALTLINTIQSQALSYATDPDAVFILTKSLAAIQLAFFKNETASTENSNSLESSLLTAFRQHLKP